MSGKWGWLGAVSCSLGISACACDSSSRGQSASEVRNDASDDAGHPVRPKPLPPRFVPGDCNLEEPAFCETFEEIHEGGRGNHINEANWSFARFGHVTTEFFTRNTSRSSYPDLEIAQPPTFCGELFDAIDLPNDVAICDGVDGGGSLSKQLNEVFYDYGGFSITSMRIRQPFDFTDRTGTIVFDVDAKRNEGFDGHGWWTELWITEDPAPIPYHGAPTIESYPREGIGFQFVPADITCFDNKSFSQVGRVVMTRNYEIVRDAADGGECFQTEDAVLNRFKVLISKNRAEFFVSDASSPGNLKKVLSTELDLNFTFGYVHFQHAQYNAHKAFNSTPAQTYRWDNIGFDGPSYPTPRAYDIPDLGEDVEQSGEIVGKAVGYYLDTPKKFDLEGVDLTNALRATFNFNFFAAGGKSLRWRMNGHDWHTFTVPTSFEPNYMLRAFTAEIPLTELLSGKNTLEIENVDSDFHPSVGNMDLTIETSG